MSRNGGPGPRYKLPPVIGYDKHCPTMERNPAYSMGIRLQPLKKALVPGPRYSVPHNFTRFGPNGTPKYSIKFRTTSRSHDVPPGPGRYRPEDFMNKVKKRAPAHVIASRTEQRRDDRRPAPCDYKIVSTIGKSQPAISMKFRHDKMPSTRTPGPAAYGATNADKILRKAPAYSIGGRRPPFGDGSRQPPYYNSKYRTGKQAPSYSFGVRHNQCTAPLILQEDFQDCD